MSLCHSHDLLHSSSAVFWSDTRRCIEMSLHLLRSLRLGGRRNRKQVGIRLLHARDLLGRLDRATKTVVVNSIRGGACGLTVHGHTYGDHVSLFGHVLMDRVIGETSKRAASSGDDGLDFIARRELLNARENVVNTFRRKHRRESVYLVISRFGDFVIATDRFSIDEITKWNRLPDILNFHVHETDCALGAGYRRHARSYLLRRSHRERPPARSGN